MTTVWITWEQLSPWNSALAGMDRASTTILMIESMEEFGRKPHHRRKLVLFVAAMREFADDVRADGWRVDYHAECSSVAEALAAHVRAFGSSSVRMMEQTEFGVDAQMQTAVAALGLVLEVTPHSNFISTAQEFAGLLSPGKTRITMETFYRAMRRKTGLLMDGNQPEGGSWNYDAKNRLPPKKHMIFPPEHDVRERPHVRAAIAVVARSFPDHPGTIDGFDLPVTRADALAYADDFFADRLAGFGPYEDAMVRHEPRLYHSRLSAAINVGLLHPIELCERAELAYRSGAAPLSSAEGFVRQLIGWREFVWRVYRHFMPEYRTRNGLGSDLPVPAWYRTRETNMACQQEALRWTFELGWAHHILRLMVLGNFGLIAGVDPQALTDWFEIMFVDGYDWVMVPNVVGMTLHADGGFIGTKPYAASANYINTMSDYCGSCAYDPKKVVGDDACPYNALYWDFIARNEARFRMNPRMSLPIRNWLGREEAVRIEIRARAHELRAKLRDGETF